MTERELESLIEFKEYIYNFNNKSFNDFDNTLSILSELNEWVYPDLIQLILDNMNSNCKPTVKEYYLLLIKKIIEESPIVTKHNLIYLIPVVSDLFWDTKEYVRNTAKVVLQKLLNSSQNYDLEPFLPIIMNTFENPDCTPDAIDKLSSCVFVQNVECSAISIIEPILIRGLKYKTSEIKKKTCVIIENICKLVKHQKELLPLISKIKPLLIRCTETLSDPEERMVAKKALSTLLEAHELNQCIIKKEYSDIYKLLNEYLLTNSIIREVNLIEIEYLSKLLTNMCNYYYFEYDIWLSLFNNYLDYPIEIISECCKYIFDKCELLFIKKE